MSTRRSRRAALAGGALVLSLGLGLLVGLVPGRGGAEPPDYDEARLAAAAASTPGDRVQGAIDGVQETGLYVAPELDGMLTDAERTHIEQTIADAPFPLYVVWWENTYDGGYKTSYDALDQLRAGVGADGYYALVSPGRPPLLDSIGYQSPYVDADSLGRPGQGLVRYVDALSGLDGERTSADGADVDYWGGRGGGVAAGLVFAVLGYLALLLVIGVAGVAVRARRAR